MLATVRTTVLPEFWVNVYPTYENEHVAYQRYVLALHDGTAGTLELVFPSAQDLRAFLAFTRKAFDAARKETSSRKAGLRQRHTKAEQTTLF